MEVAHGEVELATPASAAEGRSVRIGGTGSRRRMGGSGNIVVEWSVDFEVVFVGGGGVADVDLDDIVVVHSGVKRGEGEEDGGGRDRVWSPVLHRSMRCWYDIWAKLSRPF